ncbi:hypothetical protein NHX12_032506 [Muraenolepis orangiensis]|uniref:Sulfotransferase n=1 Tax=Muraenolepis orangiensis TaxID=630683 RepID=A0A9Q0E7Y5_9TELE|nr:hypothetical protein NHX12_032506 [Muraenolepis orangiensis]
MQPRHNTWLPGASLADSDVYTAGLQETEYSNGKPCITSTHGDMAHRFISSRSAPSSSRLNARFAVICTISLSFTYVCYNVIFCSSAIMTKQGSSEDKRCPPGGLAEAGKVPGKPNRCTRLTPDVRFAAPGAQGAQGASHSRNRSKHVLCCGNRSRYSSSSSSIPAATEFTLNNLTVAQKYGNKKLPNALIVGVKKGGTRAVLEFIRIHPDVRALGTEPHFFDRHYDRGLDWYR